MCVCVCLNPKEMYIFQLFPLCLQFFEMSTEGELRYNARIPVGCVAGDNISTYLMLQNCRKRDQPVPVDQKFVLREVSRVRPASHQTPSGSFSVCSILSNNHSGRPSLRKSETLLPQFS